MNMNEHDREIIRLLGEAVGKLPDDKREYLLGYAEGVIAAAGRRQKDQANSRAG